MVPENSQPVAIKVFHARYYADPRFAIRFREHLRRLAGVSHDNLVTVLDYGVDQTQYYIVTELVDGTDLSTYLSEYASLPPTLTIFIARQVCAALDAIHQHGLVHQGIKPENILLAADGRVKVTDVGLSRLLSDSGLSKTHVMLAGVGYISPEQARGKDLLRNLTSIAWSHPFEMLTAGCPSGANDAWSVVRMHAMETPPPQQYNQHARRSG
jgi:serine/threonine-protein kinase